MNNNSLVILKKEIVEIQANLDRFPEYLELRPLGFYEFEENIFSCRICFADRSLPDEISFVDLLKEMQLFAAKHEECGEITND